MTPTITIPIVASLALMLVLKVIEEYAPPAYPTRVRKPLSIVIFGIAASFTVLHIPLYPAAGSVDPWMIVGGLLAFATVSPFAGLLESRYRSDGQAIYSTGMLPGTTNRFPGHLLTNISGAVVACAFWWVANSTAGFDQFVAKFPYDAAVNVMVPLSAVAVFAFVRWQQVDACQDIDEAMKHPGGEATIAGFSLSHGHQLANVLHLIAATSIATISFLYLVAYGMEQARVGPPLAVSWQVVVTILATLGFLYACGGPWSRANRAVYLTFLTGTPAALGGAILWLSWFRDDTIRNTLMVSIVGIGYLLYCVEAVFADWAGDGRPPLHYFSTIGIAVVLAVLLGTMYFA
jgi:hypothetical protein